MTSESDFSDNFLAHAVGTPSQYDSTCRGMAAEILRLRAEVAAHSVKGQWAATKWQEYERDYILPCFKWAADAGIDLPALVAEANGNCVARLVETLRTQRDAAREVLLEVEWNKQLYVVPGVCSTCGHRDRHAPGCKFAAALGACLYAGSST